MKQKLTDKKLKDKRFRKTEKAIIEVFFSNKKVLSARVVVKRAKISRSTLYRHHESVYGIVPDYESYILEKYSKLMRILVRREKVRAKTLYYQMLVFILKNGDIFRMIIKRGNGQLLGRMVQRIKPKLTKLYRLPKNCEKILAIYEKEIVGVLENWIRNDFEEDETMILSDIMYLTETMRARLMPLVK